MKKAQVPGGDLRHASRRSRGEGNSAKDSSVKDQGSTPSPAVFTIVSPSATTSAKVETSAT